MLSLSDAELDVILNLARPLEPTLRDPFLRSVAAELGRHRDIGPGLVFRIGRELQREFFRAPSTSDFNSKHGR
jgi:hypothetical protein